MQYYTTTQAFFNTFMVGCSGTTGSLSFDAEKLKFICKALEKHFRSENFELYKGYVLWEIRSKSTKYSIFSARFVRANISSFWHIYSKNVKNELSSGNSNPFDYYRYFLDFLGH